MLADTSAQSISGCSGHTSSNESAKVNVVLV